MKILFLSHLFPNVARPVLGTFVFDLASELSRRCVVRVVAPVPYLPFIYRTQKYAGYDAIPLNCNCDDLEITHPRFWMFPMGLKWLEGVSVALSCAWAARTQWRDSDVVVAHWTFPDGFAGLLLRKLFGGKLILVVHGNESIFYFEARSLRKRMAHLTVRTVDHVIAVSKDLKTKIVKDIGVAPSRVTVIGNGVDPSKFPRMLRQKAREALGLAQEGRIVLCVARLSVEKAVEVAISAFGSLSDAGARLYVVGDGPERGRLEELVKKQSLEGRVVFMGNLPHVDVHWWMTAADLLVLSSVREGSPVVIGESFACGTPVVATAVGGVPDLLGDENLGVLVEPGSISAFRDGLCRALGRDWDAEYIRRRADSLGWDAVGASVVRVLESVVGDGASE